MGLVLTWPVGRDDRSTVRPPAPFSPLALYVAFSTLGGASSGLFLGAAGVAVRDGSLAGSYAVTFVAVGVAVVAMSSEWRGVMAPLPERKSQVPRRWLLWTNRTLTAAAFGLVIGTGVLTYLKHAAMYVLAVLIFLAPSLAAAALIGAAYGFCRAATVGMTWIGDRYVGRRPPLPAPASARMLRRLVAIVSIMSMAATLLLV